MIREFMKSNSQKDFALITNVNDKFLNELEEKLHFKSDDRINCWHCIRSGITEKNS